MHREFAKIRHLYITIKSVNFRLTARPPNFPCLIITFMWTRSTSSRRRFYEPEARGLFTLIFEVGDGFKGTRLPHSCQFSHIPGKTALGHILNIWFLPARLPYFWPTSFNHNIMRGRIYLDTQAMISIYFLPKKRLLIH